MAVAISAHRGGSEEHPAATWAAYRSAAATGADYVELDIRRLADGRLVCFHDPSTKPNGGGRSLQRLGYPDLCRQVGYEVPTVPEVCALLAAGGVAGHLDLKEIGYEDEVIRIALATFGPGRFVATSLEDASIAAIAGRFPSVVTALSLGRDPAGVPRRRRAGIRLREVFPLARIRRCGARWVALHQRLVRWGTLGRCARHGLGAMVWTVDDPAGIDRFLADPRVSVLVTNRPGFAVARRAALGAAPPRS